MWSRVWLPVLFGSVACAPQGQVELPPPVVGAVEALTATVTQEAQFVGTLEAVQRAELRSRIRGTIERRYFVDGDEVEKGQLLFQIDPRSPQAALAESRAGLASAQANLRKATADARRARALYESNSISKAELDNALAAERAARAAVAAARAVVEAASLDTKYTEIRAPFDGLIGKTTVNVGNLVDPSSTSPMATVVRVDPIYAEFTVSGRQWVRSQRLAESTGTQRRVEDLMVALQLVDGSFYEYQGKLAFISPEMDPTTGTFLLRALFPNPYRFLKPGMFAKVVIRGRSPSDAILVPEEAVVIKQAGAFVYTVDEEGLIRENRVTTGDPRGRLRVVREGLQPGARVVFQGVHKVRDGARVEVRNADPLTLKSDPLVAVPPEEYPGNWYKDFLSSPSSGAPTEGEGP